MRQRKKDGDRLAPMTLPEEALPHRDDPFNGFTPEERERILSAGTQKALRRGEVLFRGKEAAKALFLVESGRVKLTQLTADGQEVIMRYMAPGEVFAAVALFEQGTYPVTAQATERTRVRAWSRETLRDIVRDHPRFEANVLRIVSAHTREALSRVRELATEPVAQRLARTLLRLAGQVGRREEDGAVSIERITSRKWPRSRERRCLPSAGR